MATHFAEELTGPELKGFVSARTVGILSLGAMDPHGPHLPLSTDCDIARAHLQCLPALVPEETDVLVLPLQSIGAGLLHAQDEGTFAHRPETLLEVWADLARAFHQAGGRRLVIVSSSSGNDELAMILTRRLRGELGILTVGLNWLNLGQPEGLFPPGELSPLMQGGAIHTSLMLHYWPEAVRNEQVADFSSLAEAWQPQMQELSVDGATRMGAIMRDLNPQGALGNALEASAEKGAASAEHALMAFAELIADMAGFDLRHLESAK